MEKMHSLPGKLASLRQKTRETVNNGGIAALVKKSLQTLYSLSYYSTSSIWFCRDLHEPAPDMPGLDPKAEIDFLIDDKQALIPWLKCHGKKFTWMHIERELQLADSEGHVFVRISYGEKTAGYIKVGVNGTYIHDFGRIVTFPPETAFIYDTFILPDYRGNNLSFYAVIKTLSFLKERNYKRILCHIEGWNVASLKVFRKSGFKEICSIRFSRILGLPIFLKNGYRPMASIRSILG